jgi:hypothetical protein
VRLQRIQHQFVEFVPEKLEPGKLYVSAWSTTPRTTCAPAGAAYEVVTILGPADSSITYNGRGVSISTSIGNSNFPCKSHYWIEDNRVLWESRMTPQLTAFSRARDKAAKAREYGRPARRSGYTAGAGTNGSAQLASVNEEAKSRGGAGCSDEGAREPQGSHRRRAM